MKECGICKRVHENLGHRIQTSWCEKAKHHICQDCCIKNRGCKCPYWDICWFNKA